MTGDELPAVVQMRMPDSVEVLSSAPPPASAVSSDGEVLVKWPTTLHASQPMVFELQLVARPSTRSYRPIYVTVPADDDPRYSHGDVYIAIRSTDWPSDAWIGGYYTPMPTLSITPTLTTPSKRS